MIIQMREKWVYKAVSRTGTRDSNATPTAAVNAAASASVSVSGKGPVQPLLSEAERLTVKLLSTATSAVALGSAVCARATRKATMAFLTAMSCINMPCIIGRLF